jgi:(p)ppGpp synthase/HD superfamily hydrolase
MELGVRISTRRRELGMTQEGLAEEVFVTVETERAWESGAERPDRQSLVRLADALQQPITEFITTKEAPDWTTRDQMFSDIHMYTRMRTLAQAENLPNAYKALAYARDMHQGENRKPSKFNNNSPAVPYIVHPLMMACHAHALGIRDDQVLATAMLHDVCEDCGIAPNDLPFPENIRHSVALLTKHEGQPTKEYYDGIMTDPCASIVKALDRCNNVSTMAQCFSREKLIEYIRETEQYVYPLLEHIKNEYLEYNDAVFVIKYQILSLIESIKAMLIGG